MAAEYRFVWKLLNEAEKANIDILCLQEMKIQQGEAQALNGSLRNWQLFYQSELDTNRSNGREGGVAIFIKKKIAATQAKAFHSEGGQWIRVTCPGFNIVSVYRRPKLSKMHADTFDESLGQDLATVSNIPFLAVGDFPQDPLTFGTSRFPQAQILCPTQDSSESDIELQIPEPTRWDGSACLDWGLCHDVQCNVVTKEDKWSDHKLLHWSIPHIGISRIRIRKFAPRPNLAKPENVTQDRWNDVLRQNWHLLKDEIPKDSTWEHLCGVTQIACTKALEILAPERRQPKKGHKGQVAETIDVYRHHKTDPAIVFFCYKCCL